MLKKSDGSAERQSRNRASTNGNSFARSCEARTVLGVSDRALAVLNALLSFYPKSELTAEIGLIVFPSNAQTALRTHGMAEQTHPRGISLFVRKPANSSARQPQWQTDMRAR